MKKQRQIHHEFGPSKLWMYEACPGSYAMQRGLGEELSDMEDSDRGTLLHDATNDYQVFDELSEYDKHMVEWVRDAEVDALRHIKEKDILSDSSEVTIGDFNLFGTVDRLVETHSNIIIFERKYGHKKVKCVEQNIQCLAYAYLAYEKYDKPVHVYLIQPALKFIDSRLFTGFKRIAHKISQIISNAKEQMETGNLSLATGDQCNYCKAQMICPLKRKEILWKKQKFKTFSLEELTIIEPVDILCEIIDTYYEYKPYFELARKKLTERLSLYEKGFTYKGYKLTTSKRQYTKYDEIICELTDVRKLFATDLDNYPLKLDLTKLKKEWVKYYKNKNRSTLLEANTAWYELVGDYIEYKEYNKLVRE